MPKDIDLAQFIRDVPDFPQPGILFRDITPLLGDADAVHSVIDRFTDHYRDAGLTAVVSIESRGFLFGAPLAYNLRLPLVPVRKPGKLPAAKMSVEYSLEYGQNQLDIHSDALTAGDRVVIVDDLLATGGTAMAAAKLVEMLKAQVNSFAFLIELGFLNGRAALAGYDVFSLLTYD
ncbi:MAG: adenine phosphoribosyltransferase [Chloroflexota bacterium]